jgi:hypothetical protein
MNPNSPDAVVTIFSSGDPSEVIMAKLLLDAEDIHFAVVGEGIQDLFGLGRMFGPFNPLTGPVQIRVRSEDAALALEVLKEMREANQAEDDPVNPSL